jgi:hypothetical protein
MGVGEREEEEEEEAEGEDRDIEERVWNPLIFVMGQGISTCFSLADDPIFYLNPYLKTSFQPPVILEACYTQI